ncbi:hypothetical protein SDC9_36511 [bioreactor metagenome]|uniref:Uncharacterized protein n=1 Tax=bioreactor metagenome TaxID=1076179 RepID=A0A644VGR1_9ZZZZ
MPVEPGLETAGHDEGRGVGFDHRRAGDAVARLQLFHLVKLCIDPLLVAIELAAAELRLFRRGRALKLFLRDLRLRDRHRAAHDRPGHRIAELGRAGRGGIDAAIGVVEGLDQLVPVLGALRLDDRGFDLEVVELAAILHAEARLQLHLVGAVAVDLEFLEHALLQLLPGRLQGLRLRRLQVLAGIGGDVDVERLVIAVFEIRRRTAEGREARGPGRHDHVLEAQPLGVAVGMDRPRAAIAEAHEAARAVALARDHRAQIVAQVAVEQLDDARGRVLDRQAERVGDLFLHRVPGALAAELHLPAEEVVGVQVAEDHVAVGNGHRLDPRGLPADADAIARRIRAELDRLGVGIEPDEAARPRADRIHRHQRQRQQQPRHVGVVLDRQLVLRDQRHVEGGAADVGTGDVRIAQHLAQILRPDHPADRPRHDRARKLLRLPRDRAAMRRHHPEVEFRAVLLEGGGDLLQRLARRLGGEGLEDRGVGAMGFLAHRVIVGRGEDRNGLARGRDLFLDQIAHPPLMRGVAVGVQQRDHDALDLLRDQFARRGAGAVLAQRDHHVARHVDPLHHATGQVARHQRLVIVMGVQVDAVFIGEAEIGLRGAAHAVEILHPRIDDQPGAQPLALHHAVEHGGAGIDAGLDPRERLLERQPPTFQPFLRAGDQAERLVLRRGLRFADNEVAVTVDEERVGHRPAGIDAKHLNAAVCLFVQWHGSVLLPWRHLPVASEKDATRPGADVVRFSDTRPDMLRTP